MKRAPASSPGGGGAPPPAEEESRPWTSSEVQALLAVWADPVVQDELDSCVRNEKVFAKIQMRLLQRSGSSRSVKQVREKIKRLKADYKRLKEQSRRAGGGGGG
ncbi:myb/SANT-like DNA-binding domain-containing protein 1, partial [Lampetra planeri]